MQVLCSKFTYAFKQKKEIDFMLPHCCSKRLQSKLLIKLTARASEGGSLYPKEGFYNKGSTLTIIATPFDGYEFVRWEGSDDHDKPNTCVKGRQLNEFSHNGRATITMFSNREILAFFQVKTD